MPPLTAALAATRFGLGARPGELEEIGASGPDWLLHQLEAPDHRHMARDLPPSEQVVRSLLAERQARRRAESLDPSAGARIDRTRREQRQELYARDVMARTAQGINTSTPFFEHLVHFWSNHFTVSATKAAVFNLAGPFEREAIRPHITGRFADMLLAVVRHPAMLLYLDNAQSVGPRSPAGKRRGRGLNENLAREIMELHTLGVQGGYTQEDVTNFAKVLTGWTIAGPRHRQNRLGAFQFEPLMHEPGAQRILGKSYAQKGAAQGEAVLMDLAHHPATARFIATKLARHFIADTPPPPLVDRLATAFLDSGGDLKVVAQALIRAPESWTPNAAKLKTPDELIISTLRALSLPVPEAKRLVSFYTLLGQRPFSAPSPAGWPDRAADWAGPDAIRKRLEWIHALALHAADRFDPRELAHSILGARLNARTADAVARASDRVQGLVLLLMSPDFQRR